MGNPRNWTTRHNAMNHELEAALKVNGITKLRRRKMVERAAAGRPADIADKARVALADRRVQRNLDVIAGRASL